MQTNKLKFIHIAVDQKFVNSVHHQFENSFPDLSEYIVLVENSQKPLKHVTFQKKLRVEAYNNSNLDRIARSISVDVLVIFHGLFHQSSILVNKISKDVKLYWIFYGFEFYNNPYFINRKDILGNLTLEIDEKIKASKRSLKNILRKKIKRIFNRIWFNTNNQSLETKKAMERIDYLGVTFEEDLELIKSKINNEKLQHFIFSFFPIEEMVSDESDQIYGNDILLGNSSHYTNNHAEAFDILSKLDLDNHKVIVPLSYGDKYYGKEVEIIGANKIGNNLMIIKDFMPLTEYTQFIKRCGYVIMNNYRQQAVGNVFVMLWMGAKVFLDERNTLYKYLIRSGSIVFSISKDLDQKSLSMPLTDDEIEHNRKILIEEIGRNNLATKLKIFFSKQLYSSESSSDVKKANIFN
ncbi:TDP-N-acetylfucosamine:lipid II N-acetylfucosaminyltransferase [Leeuwenhoekiella sp. LLG6367-2.1]|uniref:TDP-N-acetylfucosamine:lipid II N-acetylfucosaminyltransferase n=1 Tax=Leeuwenhoekiella sp. LLG6367-2.1 TaxID=3160833 RepID=UPI00387015C1